MKRSRLLLTMFIAVLLMFALGNAALAVEVYGTYSYIPYTVTYGDPSPVIFVPAHYPYVFSFTIQYNGSSAWPQDVGVYTVSIKPDDPNDYCTNYNILTVLPKFLNGSFEGSPHEVYYMDPVNIVFTPNAEWGTIGYKLLFNGSSTVPKDVGKYTVTVLPNDSNYKCDMMFILDIVPKPVNAPQLIWHDNTACCEGLRFRDIDPDLTDNWYMFTPVDLSENGITTYRLIASNARVIGTVAIEVAEGNVTVGYKITAGSARVSNEYMAFFPDWDSLAALDRDKLPDQDFAFGQPISISGQLMGDTSQLLFIRNVVTYQPDEKGVLYFSDASKEHQELVNELTNLLQE